MLLGTYLLGGSPGPVGGTRCYYVRTYQEDLQDQSGVRDVTRYVPIGRISRTSRGYAMLLGTYLLGGSPGPVGGTCYYVRTYREDLQDQSGVRDATMYVPIGRISRTSRGYAMLLGTYLLGGSPGPVGGTRCY